MKNCPCKKLLVLLFLITITVVGNAQQTPQKMVVETNYLLYLPDGYNDNADTQWPLVVFLHGSGERGTDVEKVKVHGLSKLIEQGQKFPFIVVSPQTPPGERWRPTVIYDVIRTIKQNYRVDDDRVYLTGLSMGGAGTWNTAIEYPELFAAIVPVCGRTDTTRVWNLRNMPAWCFHGAKDNIVPLSESLKMVDALERYNDKLKITVYALADHDSWSETYNNPQMYEWMLAQKRFKYEQKTIDNKLLDQYAGKYCVPGKDTVTMTINGNGLQVETKNGIKVPLKPAGNKLFFIEPNRTDCVEFDYNAKKKTTTFTAYSKQEKAVYQKLK